VGSYIDKGTLGISFGVDVTAYQNTLLRAGSPFIKRKVFFEQGFAQEDQAETLKLLCELGYPLEFFHVQKTAVKDCRANNVGASCTVGASKQVLRTMLERVVKNIILFFYGPIKSRIVNKIDKIHEQTHRLHAELMRLHKRLDSFTYASPTSEQHKQPATAHTGLEAANETLSQDYDEKYFIWHEECPLCQRQIIKVEHFSFPEPMYYLYRCLDCGMIFLNPWNTRSETYPDDFFLHLRQTLINTGVINEDNSINFLTAEAWYECALALTRKHHIGCDIIDIGAGYGMLTALLQHRNFPTVALERSEVLTSIARDIFKTNVLCCDIDTYNGKKFGFGVLNAVIEHVHNPIAFLKNIRTNLFTADAKLVVTSLNILSTQSVFEIENSFCFSSGHVWYFSEATLCMLMERAGFKLIELYRPNLPLSEPHKNLATYLVDFCGLDINYYGATAGIWSAAE
jgi:SAM-dependent methyltransferase